MYRKIEEYAADMGISLKEASLADFALYAELLLTTNKQMNLTRITEPHEVMVKHFLDSLALLAKIPDLSGPLLDVGSGAGLPGIPLKIARPEVRITIIDSSQKKINFLEDAVKILQLKDVRVFHGRAEDLGKEKSFREQFPIVVSRAVARLNVLAELCLPFVSVDGTFIAYKGPEATQELEEAKNALNVLGSLDAKTWKYRLPEQMGDRCLVFLNKQKRTPCKYPRKAGKPAKRPLV